MQYKIFFIVNFSFFFKSEYPLICLYKISLLLKTCIPKPGKFQQSFNEVFINSSNFLNLLIIYIYIYINIENRNVIVNNINLLYY